MTVSTVCNFGGNKFPLDVIGFHSTFAEKTEKAWACLFPRSFLLTFPTEIFISYLIENTVCFSE